MTIVDNENPGGKKPPQDQSKVTPIGDGKIQTGPDWKHLLQLQDLPDELLPTSPAYPGPSLDLHRLQLHAGHKISSTSGPQIGIAEHTGMIRFYHPAKDFIALRSKLWVMSAGLRLKCQHLAAQAMDIARSDPNYLSFCRYWETAAAPKNLSSHQRGLAETFTAWALALKPTRLRDYNNLANPETCVWSMSNGGVYSLHGRKEIKPDDVLNLKITAPKDNITIPDLGENEQGAWPDWIRQATGPGGVYEGLLDFVARAIARPERNCLGVLVAPSGYGKTTLAKVLEDALPGQIVARDTDVLLRDGKQFAPLHRYMSEFRLVIADEGQQAKITGDKLRTATADDLAVELKGVDSIECRRTAALLLIGTDWPPIDPDTDGLKDRLTYIQRLDDVGITPEQRALMIGDDVIRTFRLLIRQRVETLLQMNAATNYSLTPQHVKDNTEFHKAAWREEYGKTRPDISPAALALLELLGEGSSWKHTSADLKQMLLSKNFKVDGSSLGKTIREAYPKAEDGWVGKARGWRHAC